MVFIKNIAIAFILIISSASASPMPEAEAKPQLKACIWKGCTPQSTARCDPVTLRWVPAHKGVAGNEMAEQMAKKAAVHLEEDDRFSKQFMREASLAYLKRKTSDIKTTAAKEWIKTSTSGSKAKEIASRYHQLLTGHALIVPYLKEKLGKRESDTCWWCDSGKRQTREHLFKECSRWRAEIRDL
ncbi:hypothetical protein FPQ18DRAFT_405087 [Pyronema domesticum]|nr:hypothetical protein FPQ18DRAFT_405087 [Pyronema domesticum]